MLYQRSLLRELSSVAAAVFSVLLAIMLTTQVVRFFDKAAAGQLATDAILAMIAFTALGSFGTLLSITTFISILIVFTRMYRDHEMAVWNSSGLSPARWVLPVMMFTLPLVVLITLTGTTIAPWAYRKGNDYAELIKQREDISALTPGIFKETRTSGRVYFVENFSKTNGSARNIFVESVEDGVISTVLARRGHLETLPSGERYLVLESGRRYRGWPGTANYDVVEFDLYKIKIEQTLILPTEHATKMRSTLQLWQGGKADERAELAWRFSLPVATIILSLFALSLAHYNPRSGTTLNLFIALFIYQFYYQMMSLFKNLIAQGKLPSAWMILGLHVLMLMLAIFLLFIRRKPWAFQLREWKARRALKN